MANIKVSDLSALEKLNEQEALLVIGGGCFHDGTEYQHGDAIVNDDGLTFRCKQRNNGSFKWKQPFFQSLGNIISIKKVSLV